MPSLVAARPPDRPLPIIALDRLAAATDELLRLDPEALRADRAAALALVDDAAKAVVFARMVIDHQNTKGLA